MPVPFLSEAPGVLEMIPASSGAAERRPPGFSQQRAWGGNRERARFGRILQSQNFTCLLTAT